MIRLTNHSDTLSIHTQEPTVVIVDDDAEVRHSLVELARSWNYRAEAFDSAESFLSAGGGRVRPVCVVTRETLPGMSGLELLDQLHSREPALPVIVLANEPDVPLAVRAMRHGAASVVEKGAQQQQLRDALRQAIQQNADQQAKLASQRELQRRLSRLTAAEMEVLELMIAGKANKNIARQQVVSLRTVETRRQQIFQKMEADSLAELVLMIVQARTGQTLPEGPLAEHPLSQAQ